MSSATMIFGGGVPTAPDIKRLVDGLGIPKEGAIVDYEKMCKILHTDRRDHRFRTVASAWKKKLFKDNNILMVAVPGVGYKAAVPSERIVNSKSRVSSGFRKIKSGSVIAQSTDRKRLTADEKSQQDKLSMMHAQLVLAQRTQPKELPDVE